MRNRKKKRRQPWITVSSPVWGSILFIIVSLCVIDPYIKKHGERTIGYVYSHAKTNKGHAVYNRIYYIAEGKEYRSHGGPPGKIVKVAYLKKCPRLHVIIFDEDQRTEEADKGSSKGKHRNRNVE